MGRDTWAGGRLSTWTKAVSMDWGWSGGLRAMSTTENSCIIKSKDWGYTRIETTLFMWGIGRRGSSTNRTMSKINKKRRRGRTVITT